jgi:hypothetical protein
MTPRIRELITAAVLRAWFDTTPEPMEDTLLSAAVEAVWKTVKEKLG